MQSDPNQDLPLEGEDTKYAHLQVYHPVGKFEYDIIRIEEVGRKNLIIQCDVPLNEFSPRVGSELILIAGPEKFIKVYVSESNKDDFSVIYHKEK